MAIGASPKHVIGFVFRQTLSPVACGLAGGLLIAWRTTHGLEQLLFEVPPRDPAVFAASAVVLLAAAAMATWPPARHVTRLDPMTALPTE